MRKKVVCFDLDDTLYKEKSYLVSGYRQIAEAIERQTGANDVLRHMCHLRREGKNVFEEVENEYDGIISKAEMLAIYRKHFPTIILDDGVKGLLEELKNRGCVIGLITDGRSVTQRNKIKALGLFKWIDDEDIIISEEFGSEKPDERNYRYFEKRYPGCRYYYVGDNPQKDFITPNKLGWDTYGIKDLFDENIHNSDFDNVELEKKPKHIVDCASRLACSIVPPLENEYIVPVMEDITREDSLVGTGVIVGDYLVTASHVFYNGKYTELKYRFDDRQFLLKLRDAVFDGHLSENREGYSKDLIVFKANHKGSPFSLNDGNIDDNTVYNSMGYHYDYSSLRTDNLDGIKLLKESIEANNCLLVKASIGNSFHEGNSGCPIYNDDIVYGTLWRGHKSTDRYNGDYRYLIVDARYITEIISSLDESTN